MIYDVFNPALSTRELLKLYVSAQDAYINQPSVPLLMTDGTFDQLKTVLTTRADQLKTVLTTRANQHDPLEDIIRSTLGVMGPTPKGRVVQREYPMLSITTDTRYTCMDGLRYFEQIVARYAESQQAFAKDRGQALVFSSDVNAELKHDGLAVELVYVSGFAGCDSSDFRLDSASLRGDGYVGEDVTNKVHQGVLKVPKWVIPPVGTDPYADLVVRGEAVMLTADLLKYNNAALARGEKTLANARNAASGIMRRSEAADTGLEFIGYDLFTIHKTSGLTRPIRYQRDITAWCIAHNLAEPLKLLAQTPLLTPYVCHSANAEVWRKMLGLGRSNLPWDIDGVVYKAEDTLLRDLMGATKDSPRGLLAHKLPPVEVETRVVGIINQVGRSGKITPVAKLKPVEVWGVEVSSVTLHNWSELQRKGVYVGADVVIRRAGDVIPELVSTLGDGVKMTLNPPTHCPCCNTLLVSKGAELMCVNDVCSEKVAAGLLHWASKSCMDIDGVGPEMVAKWMDDYKHKLTRLTALGLIPYLSVWADSATRSPGMRSANEIKVAQNIQASRQQEMYRLLCAMGIERVGTAVAKDIACALPSKRSLGHLQGLIREVSSTLQTDNTTVCEDALLKLLFGEVEGGRLAGLVAYRNFAAAMFTPELRNLFGFLTCEYAPVNTLGRTPDEDGVRPFSDTTFVFTGAAADGHTRQSMQALALKLGGKVSDSVTKKCSIAVIGDGAGKKAEAAAKANVKVWTPEMFIQECQKHGAK